MAEPLSEEQFGRLFGDFERTAFRLELQRQYREASEATTVARFLAGDRQPPTEVPGLTTWFELVRTQTCAGKHIERVRVHEEPPTDYQRWERWSGRWNIEAGEVVRYLTRSHAYEIGLLPGAGNTDWWLLDERTLIVMTFDSDGRRLGTELSREPAAIEQACLWRDLAIRHSEPETVQDSGA